MRQVLSSGSVKGFYLDKSAVLFKLRSLAKIARTLFPEIKDIRLFGSLATNQETGLSDVDIFIISDTKEQDPILRIRPYFDFFITEIELSLDVLVATPKETEFFKDILKNSISLIDDKDSSTFSPSCYLTERR